MQDVNFVWYQGEDMTLEFRYKEGNSAATARPVNLAAGYTARMTLALPGSGQTPLVVLDSDNGEILLTSGVNEPNIVVRLPRSLTLSGGALNTGGSYSYDLFLRNTSTDLQIKVVEGTISVRRSVTQWA